MAGARTLSRASGKTSAKKVAATDLSKAKSTSKKSTSLVTKPPIAEEEPATETTAAPDVETDAEMSDGAKNLLSLEVALTSNKERQKLSCLLAVDEDLDCVAFIVYPKANTPGCTKQVNAFNAKVEEFRQLGVQLVGLSPDKLEAQKKFVESEDLDFPLINGSDNELLTILNCLVGGKVLRSVICVDSLGNVFYEKHKVKPEESCVDLLKFLKERKDAEESGSDVKNLEPFPPAEVEASRKDASEGTVSEEKLKKTRSKKPSAHEKPEKAVKKAPATKRVGKTKSDETIKTKKKPISTRSCSSKAAKA